MDYPKDTQKEVVGSFAGYVIMVGVLLTISHIVGLLGQREFVMTLAGFLGGTGLTRRFWLKNLQIRQAWVDEGRQAILSHKMMIDQPADDYYRDEVET